MHPAHIVILYDSISNSVFESQVLAPLLKRKKKYPEQSICIASFEKDSTLKAPCIDGISFKLYKRIPYISSISLYPCVQILRSFLKQFDAYTLKARGPFAGYIAYKAATPSCKAILIQARGLVAQEYAYSKQKEGSYKWYARCRAWLFERLERYVYTIRDKKVLIEAVSPALKDYLTTTIDAQADQICLAQHDIPSSIQSTKRLHYRTMVRKQLHIPEQTTVYCYSGSYKPWQCPQQMIVFFKQQLRQHNNSHLLICTQDVDTFLHHIERIGLPKNTYTVRHVPINSLMTYLAAADYGLLFREQHPINWVSRPTKALEYHAAGLTIIHNNTVGFIHRIPGNQRIVSV